MSWRSWCEALIERRGMVRELIEAFRMFAAEAVSELGGAAEV